MKRLVLILALVCSSCTAHLVKDVNGNQRLKWSNPTIAGYSVGMSGMVAGGVIAVSDDETFAPGLALGAFGLATVVFTMLACGTVFDEAPAPLPVGLGPQPAQAFDVMP